MNTETLIGESVAYIREHTASLPSIGIVLGSGLGDFVDGLTNKTAINTADIPHYPRSTVEGHKGKLVFGSMGTRKDVLAFQGRVHFYESNSVETVLYPIRVAHRLGVKTLLVTNAAGGVNRGMRPGDLMVITNQINLTGIQLTYPLGYEAGHKPLYNRRLIEITSDIAEANGLAIRKGVYAGLKGPSYETASEVEMVHRIGGDAVGMSTVLEVSLASQLGMEILGISCITNLGTGIGKEKLSHTEVTEVGNRVKTGFALLLSRIIDAL